MIDSLISFLRSEVFRQFVRYAVVGVAINSIGFCIYLLLTWLGIPPVLTMSMLYVAAVLLNFFASKNITFNHKGSQGGAAVRYGVAHLGGYLINLGLLLYFHDRLNWPHQWVQGGSTFIVALYLFVVFKLFVFRDQTHVASHP